MQYYLKYMQNILDVSSAPSSNSDSSFFSLRYPNVEPQDSTVAILSSYLNSTIHCMVLNFPSLFPVLPPCASEDNLPVNNLTALFKYSMIKEHHWF